MLYYENKAKKEGFSFIIGIDEAGRGPLAGPVVAAAVSLKQKAFRSKIADSKKLTASQREKAFVEIFDKAHVGIGIINETAIDAVNILQATYRAMERAVLHLISRLPDKRKSAKDFPGNICLLIDGNSFQSDLPYAYRTIVKGDNASLSVACASIIAKVTRDRILNAYDRVFPGYGFKKHKGYPTLAHRLAIRKYGMSPIQRKSFSVAHDV